MAQVSRALKTGLLLLCPARMRRHLLQSSPNLRKAAPRGMKLLFPHGEVSQEDLAEILECALEGRRRVKEQLKKMGSFEYYHTSFSYTLQESGEERFVGGIRSLLSAGMAVALAVPDRRTRGRIADTLAESGLSITRERDFADGADPGGHVDARPLSIKLDKVPARYVRIQLPERNTVLHLDEVEIFPSRQRAIPPFRHAA